MNKPGALIFGIICLAVGLMMFMNSPRHFEDDTAYRRTKTYGGKVLSSEVVSGQQLNIEEPSNNRGIRIGGALFMLFGGALLWGYYSDRKAAMQKRP